ncbi:MAG TPA: Ig domain-containing protein, partial [Gemmataceae bacterium]|nr:Ig domain-containing protein [Gemmataceae bacterium]
GDMPKRRWLITKTDLLVAQAIGYRLRPTSPFEPLTAKAKHEPKGTVGRPFQSTLAIRGGLPPYFCSVAEGKLPPGLAIDSFTGEVTGVPSEAGVFDVKVQVRDHPKSEGVIIPMRIEIGR